MTGKLKGKRWMAILSLTLAAMLPLAAMAQGANNNTNRTGTTENDQGMGTMMRQGGGDIDLSTLTDAQKTVYEQAVALYEQVEDQVLSDLVTAGVVTQADVDTYAAQRTADKALYDIDTSAWTAAQYKAYYEANDKTGDERKAAMQALADAGQLTQAQADALAARSEASLWNTLTRNQATNTAIQTAMNTMRQARQTLQQTLHDADIQGNYENDWMMNGRFGGNGFYAQDGDDTQYQQNNGGMNHNRNNDGTVNHNATQNNGVCW